MSDSGTQPSTRGTSARPKVAMKSSELREEQDRLKRPKCPGRKELTEVAVTLPASRQLAPGPSQRSL
jgi:hypothetical protein